MQSMAKKLSLLAVLAFVAGIASLGYKLMGLVPAIVFTIAFGGGVILWLSTTFRTQIDPNKVIVPYLLTVIFLWSTFTRST